MNWINLAQNREQWWELCEYSNESKSSINGKEFFLNSSVVINFCRSLLN